MRNYLFVILIAFLLGCGTEPDPELKQALDEGTISSNFDEADTWSAPSGSVVINNGDESTSNTVVSLNLSASDTGGKVSAYYASETNSAPSSTTSGWVTITGTENYSATTDFTVSSAGTTGEHSRTVYVWYKDSVGNISTVASDSITLIVTDTTAPNSPAISINSDNSSTSNTVVTLTLSASDDYGISAYYASETNTTPASTDSGWSSVTSSTAYSSTVNFTLSSASTAGSHTRTVYVWFKDAAGNVSASASDGITLVVADTTALSVVSVEPTNGSSITTRSPTISITFSETMTSSTVDNTTLTLEDSSGNKVGGTVSLNNSENKATYSLLEDLNADNFTVTATTNLKSQTGKNLAQNYSWNFDSYSVWTQVTSSASWSARNAHTSVVFDNKMWVIGGVGGINSSSRKNDVWYSTDGVTWIQATSNAAWAARSNHTSVVFNNKMWVIGGYIGAFGPSNEVWYSSDGSNWFQATSSASWSERSGYTSVVFDNKIWVIGGGNKNDVWYSSDGVNWTLATGDASWSKRWFHTSLAYNDKIWIIGGQSNSTYMNDVWNSSDGVNWRRVSLNASWSARSNHTSVIIGNKMWVSGGKINSKSNDVWSSTDGLSWTQIASNASWSARSSHTSVVFDNKIWVIGGSGVSGHTNDVWSF